MYLRTGRPGLHMIGRHHCSQIAVSGQSATDSTACYIGKRYASRQD